MDIQFNYNFWRKHSQRHCHPPFLSATMALSAAPRPQFYAASQTQLCLWGPQTYQIFCWDHATVCLVSVGPHRTWMNFSLCWAQTTAGTDHTLSENLYCKTEFGVSTVAGMQRGCREDVSACLKIAGFTERRQIIKSYEWNSTDSWAERERG